MRYLMPLLAAAAAVLSTTPAYAQLGDQWDKLLPDDGAAGDQFGFSAAMSGATVVVGAWRDDDNGTNSGSAYLFNAITGVQIAKLLPSDGAAGDQFGFSVAISGHIAIVGARFGGDNGDDFGAAYLFNTLTGVQIAKLLRNDGPGSPYFGSSVGISGATAIVGAPDDTDNGPAAGSAYLFDTTTGQQIRELLPDDGAAGVHFGGSVAISGTTAVVGAYQDFVNGPVSGSAYLFDTSTGAQTAKLLPNDGEDGEFFGLSVAISGNTALVSAQYDDNNGHHSGSAYLFDATTGAQLAKLLPDDGVELDQFGISVAISGNTAIVGASWHDDNGSGSGSAYFFDATTGDQLLKLLPDDGATGQQFGRSVAISGTFTVVGAIGGRDNDVVSGSAYVFIADNDTDEDGLFDSWETLGIPYIGVGGAELRFTLPDADPRHKDLYVEVDAMTGLSLSNAAKEMVAFAFEAAPLTNPDSIEGITLHVQIDDINVPHIAVWQTDGCWPLDFDTYRTDWFGTLAESLDPDSEALLEAKALAYRYCIVADSADNPATANVVEAIGGCGQTPGDNFVLFIGGGAYNDENQAAVFMHELGHNLSLKHGGGDGINGKPNYPSIMNYVLSYKYTWNSAFWKLDYSRADAGNLATLNESSLDEPAGIGTPAGLYSHYQMPFGVNELDGSGNTVRRVEYVILDGTATDFGDTEGTMFQDQSHDTGVEQDLNYAVETPFGISLPGVSSPGEPLNPYDDWANVGLPLAAALGAGAPAISYPTDELTTEARDWIDANFPPPPRWRLRNLDGEIDPRSVLRIQP